jgi:hypothetical protein
MEINFQNINYSRPDNLVCSLTLTVNTDSHQVTWPGFWGDPPPDEIKSVFSIFNEIRDIAEKVAEGKVDK